MRQARIHYLSKEEDGPIKVKVLDITDYDIPQLDRVEKKVDRILELLEGQKQRRFISTDNIATNIYEDVKASDMRIGSSDGEIKTGYISDFGLCASTKKETSLEKLEKKVKSLESVSSSIFGELKLKVDSNLVIDAINNSPEGIRIRGSKIKIDKDTLLEDGVIKT